MVVVLSLGAVWLYYFMIRHAAATRVVEPLLSDAAGNGGYGVGAVRREAGALALVGMAVCVVGVFLVNWRPAQP